MPNTYGIPEDRLMEIRARDTVCVYCHKAMQEYPNRIGTPKDKATIEHLNILPPWNNPSTVVICCGSCNSSRGNKKLLDWFGTSYCMEKNINGDTVADVVKTFIKQP